MAENRVEVVIRADTSMLEKGTLSRLTRSLSSSGDIGAKLANAINNTINKKVTAAKKNVENVTTRAGLKVERSAKQKSPVDTGRLRASINTKVKKDLNGVLAVVGTDVEYSHYVEYGSSKAPAQPYLNPALTENIDSINKEIDQAIEEGLRR